MLLLLPHLQLKHVWLSTLSLWNDVANSELFSPFISISKLTCSISHSQSAMFNSGIPNHPQLRSIKLEKWQRERKPSPWAWQQGLSVVETAVLESQTRYTKQGTETWISGVRVPGVHNLFCILLGVVRGPPLRAFVFPSWKWAKGCPGPLYPAAHVSPASCTLCLAES